MHLNEFVKGVFFLNNIFKNVFMKSGQIDVILFMSSKASPFGLQLKRNILYVFLYDANWSMLLKCFSAENNHDLILK